jgi:thiol-disulfide isomerase/thioredoxin
MNMPLRRFPLACVLVALAAVSACKREPSAESAPEPAPASAPQVADPAAPVPGGDAQVPTLRVQTIDGGTFDLAERRGQWVVVNFWATWCSPCLKEMPELSALDAMREHIDVIGLAYEETTPEAMRAFLEERPVVYPIALIDVFDPPADFETPRGLPVTYLIAPDGRVAKRFTGPVTAAQLEAEIAAAGGPKVG